MRRDQGVDLPSPGRWLKPGKRRLLDRDGAEAAAEKRKALCKVEPVLYVKRRFGYGKVRYRGLAKNTQRIALRSARICSFAGRYATG